jgi:PAS domain S-box-containing protein
MTGSNIKTIVAEAELAAIVDSSFDAIISKNLNGIITSWNRAAEQLFGYSAEEAIGKSILIIIPESHRHEEDQIISRVRSGERMETFETLRRRKDGTLVPISITVSPIRDREGRIVGASKIARDISRTKEAERQIHLLLREVHHRVKNNLQTVASLVQLQPMPDETKQELRGRILAMAAVHENLHRPDADGQVELGRYLRDLAARVNATFGNRLTLDLELEAVPVSAEMATSIGLIANELVANTNKYAFPDGKFGHLAIRLSREGETAHLAVSNNGVPFNADAGSNGIGIRLIRGLAVGISSNYEFDGRNGLHFEVHFPLTPAPSIF